LKRDESNKTIIEIGQNEISTHPLFGKNTYLHARKKSHAEKRLMLEAFILYTISKVSIKTTQRE